MRNDCELDCSLLDFEYEIVVCLCASVRVLMSMCDNRDFIMQKDYFEKNYCGRNNNRQPCPLPVLEHDLLIWLVHLDN